MLFQGEMIIIQMNNQINEIIITIMITFPLKLTQVEAFQVECQRCLWFMHFTHFARPHIGVIQVLQSQAKS